MKRKYVYELQYHIQYQGKSWVWKKSMFSIVGDSIQEIISFCKAIQKTQNYDYRVVQKLDRKIVKQIYPKVKK